jgi:hypothetical protein
MINYFVDFTTGLAAESTGNFKLSIGMGLATLICCSAR